MGINLQKGQTINLDKDQNDLSKLTIGLGWQIKKKKKGFLGGLIGGDGDEFDLDAMAFLLDAEGKIVNLGDQKLQGGDVIYFNNLQHPSGHVTHTGDNLVGGAGVKDDEQIIVNLRDLKPVYSKIVFLVTIYQGTQKGQHFGQVEKAFIRAADAKGNEIARYQLSDDPTYDNKRSMLFAEVYRKDSSWKFRAIGNSYATDNFVDLLKDYARV